MFYFSLSILLGADGEGLIKQLRVGSYSLGRHRFIRIWIPIINLRRSSDRLRFIMGIPILIRRHLFSEHKPWYLCSYFFKYTANYPNRLLVVPTFATGELCLIYNACIWIFEWYIADVVLHNIGLGKFRPCGACASIAKGCGRKYCYGERSLARVCRSAHVRWCIGSSRVGVDCCSLLACKVRNFVICL